MPGGHARVGMPGLVVMLAAFTGCAPVSWRAEHR
jgi:hypothetical protein